MAKEATGYLLAEMPAAGDGGGGRMRTAAGRASPSHGALA